MDQGEIRRSDNNLDDNENDVNCDDNDNNNCDDDLSRL